MGKKRLKIISGIFSMTLMMSVITACGNVNSSTTEKNAGKTDSKTAATSSGNVLSIATTPVGASYNSVGSGLAKVISDNSKVKLTVKPFESLGAYGPLVDQGKVQMAVASDPDIYWSMNGEQNYKTPTKNLRLVVRGNFLTETGLVVRADSNIKKNTDLKGKRVAVYPGAGIGQAVVEAFLKANGMSLKDVVQVPETSLVAGIQAIQDNQVDAAMEMTPGTPIMTQVNSQVPIRALNFVDSVKPSEIDKTPKSIVKIIQSTIPGATMAVQKPTDFIKEDTVAFNYPASFIASASVSNDDVYIILDTLWKNYEKLQPIHPWLKTWTPEQMFNPKPVIPYHPGAVKFFKEKGLWNDKVDKIQNDLLKKYK